MAQKIPSRTGNKLNAPVKIDLKMNIKNFGPISDGEIELKPLTVFIGPNNSGKSYAAMLVHSILSSEIESFPMRMLFMHRAIEDIASMYGNDIERIIKKNKNHKTFFMPTSLTNNITAHIVQKIFKTNLETTLRKNFGSTIAELVTAKTKSSKIHVSNSTDFDMLLSDKLTIKYNLNKNIKYRIFAENILSRHAQPGQEKNIIDVPIDPDEFRSKLGVHEVFETLTREIIRRIRQEQIPTKSFYFPAARSGILQGHKALSASIINSASYGGIESIEMPRLTGVVSDFISNIIMLDKRRGPFYTLATQLESELLGGEIEAVIGKNHSFPEIMYKTSSNDIPLHRTSSTISEIAPFSLYLKHIVTPNSMLIIEEPEAHLHPANQAIFAKYVARMIRSGLNILITTHSVILLNELGKYMRTSNVAPKFRKKLDWNKDDCLDFDEVSAYVFEKRGNLHNIKRIETNTEDGIPQDEFSDVYDRLYKDELTLQKLVDG